MIEFGEHLRTAREAKGMTQQALAEKLFVTRQTISRWESGDRFPDLLNTKRLSEILEVSMDDLMANTSLKTVVEKSDVNSDSISKKLILLFYFFISAGFIILALDILLRFVGIAFDIKLLFKFIGYHIDLTPTTNIVGIKSMIGEGGFIALWFQPVIYLGRAILAVLAFNTAIKGNMIPKNAGIINTFYLFIPIICSIYSFYEVIIAGNEIAPNLAKYSISVVLQLVLLFFVVMFFIKNKYVKIGSSVIYSVSAFRVVFDLYWLVCSIVFAFQHHNFSYQLYCFFALEIMIYISLIYQTAVLNKKRKIANNEKASLC